LKTKTILFVHMLAYVKIDLLNVTIFYDCISRA